MTPKERYTAISNVIARKGLENINLHAELARLESYVNGIDQEALMNPPVSPLDAVTAPISGEEGLDTGQGEITPETPPIVP